MINEIDRIDKISRKDLCKEKKTRIKNPIAKGIVLLTIFSLAAITVVVIILALLEAVDLEEIFLGLKKNF